MSYCKNAQNIPNNIDYQHTPQQDAHAVEDLNTQDGAPLEQFVYDGGPIPEAARLSYIQQKLPVRKQSLVAYGRNHSSCRQKSPPAKLLDSSLRHSDRLARALTIGTATSAPLNTAVSDNGYRTPIRSATVTSTPSSTLQSWSTSLAPSSSNDNNGNSHSQGTTTSTNDLHSSLPTIHSSNLSTSTQHLHLSTSPNVVDSITVTEHKDDRTPLAKDCTQPLVSTPSIMPLYATTATAATLVDTVIRNDSPLDQQKEINPTPSTQQEHGPVKNNDNIFEHITLSSSVPAITSNNSDSNQTGSLPSIPISSLSKAIVTNDHNQTKWGRGSFEDTVRSATSSSKTDDHHHHHHYQQLAGDDNTTDLFATVDTLPEKIQEQLWKQNSQKSYYMPALSPTLSTPSSHVIKSSPPSRSSSLMSSLLYPALLSHVAQGLHRRLSIKTLIKSGIEYPLAFNGKEAVDCLLQILRTNDRNLGLLVGRALSHQHFFHDVTYEHHLRDSQDKIYQFKNPIKSSRVDYQTTTGIEPSSSRANNDIGEKDLPNGVFVLLTMCYSPTCTRNQGCYSTYCPRKEKSAKRHSDQTPSPEKEDKCSLWIQSVPKAIVDITTKEEIKRQECIYELIYTEGDFVNDLHYMHNFWVKPLITQDIIPDERREHFVQEVFWNLADIEKVNLALYQALKKLQKKRPLVNSIGGVLMDYVCHFDPFVAYGSHHIIGKFKLELEKKRNSVFARFVHDTERRPESRRLDLNGFLTKPISRLGRYNLFLREILRRTPKDNPDHELIPKVMDTIAGYLMHLDTETGKCENIFNLQQIEERLCFKSVMDHVDLTLRDPRRRLILQGRMKRKGNTSSEASDLQVFLFDHYLVFAKIKYFDHLEYYKVHRKPIPLELLTISTSSSIIKAKRASNLLAYSRTSIGNMNSQASLQHSTPDTISPSRSILSNSITFYHHGRKGSPPMTLYAHTPVSHKTWTERIYRQQNTLSTKQAVFTLRHLVDHQFLTSHRIYNSIVINNNNITTKTTVHYNNQISSTNDYTTYTLLISTDIGIYMKFTNNMTGDIGLWDLDNQQTTIKQVIRLDRITQMELLNDSHLLILADKTLWMFSLGDILDSFDKPLSTKKGRIISTNTTLFHIGECMNKTMVCIVKPNTLTTTTVRVLEPFANDAIKKTKSRPSIRPLVRNGPVGFKTYKDLSLPSESSSICLLGSKMCISYPKEIGVVDMKSFGVQALLDPGDDNLSFVFSRQDIRPITIYRVHHTKYLVCYNEFGFFVDQRGRWIQSSHIMEWESEPDSFAMSYPHVLAFEPGFIEVRNILTGNVDQIIRGTNIRCTNSKPYTIQGSMNATDIQGHQIIFQLDRISPSK
ncbi:hypothetical protein BC941DRAFT_417744 [Chlamydoabsidia padenii]|nr:hypothetical protein BC941DRAFT_417744 [Chlamydoabsidia padenii]